MQKGKKAAIGIFQLLCVSAGTVAAFSFSACKISLARSGVDFFSPFLLLFLICIVIIEIISCVKISDSTIHTVLYSCCLLISYLCSSDMQNFFQSVQTPSFESVADIINFAAFHGIALSSLYFMNFTYKLGVKKPIAVLLILASGISFAAYLILFKTNLRYLAYAAYMPVLCAVLILLYKEMIKRHNCDYTFYLSISILYAAIGMQTVDVLNKSGFFYSGTDGFSSIYVALIVIIFAAIYITYIIKTEQNARKASDYKLQAEMMKSKILREQINPHFIFNSLTTVKEMYHHDLERGDSAIGFFSKHLRANVEAMNIDLIPFEEELDLIENYVKLENMKREQAINLVYDIACTDFYVPILSLQVFVENAVKYAKTELKDDGYIEISSYEVDGAVVLEINDNGVGFDVNNISKSSCGIANSLERFKLILDTDIEIISRQGLGTSVKIHLKSTPPLKNL